MNAHQYNVGITWENGRKGLVFSPEVSVPPYEGGFIEVATPPQFPKGIPGVWSPEHLLVASVASCLMATFLAVAENYKLDFLSFSCDAQGKLEIIDGSWLVTEVVLLPKVRIAEEAQRERAEKALLRSEKSCLISNSIRSKVMMFPEIEVAERISVLDVK